MRLNVIATTLATVCLAIAAQGAAAADFDGSKPLLCAPSSYNECTAAGCQPVDAASITAPSFLRVDAKRKRIEPVQGGAGRTGKIDHVETIDGKLILQGVEDGVEDVRDGIGYSLAIAQDTGRMVLSASADDVAFVAFGACTPD
ncbi:MAG: hypothetical protein ACR2PZ_10485 [Pseudomonadales bacterium]